MTTPEKTHTSSLRAHQIDSQPAAMIARPGGPALAVPHAANLAHLALVLGHDLLRPFDRHLLARPDPGDIRRREPATAPAGLGQAALEVARPRAETGLRRARLALVDELARAAAAARRLGAALDVVRVVRACARDVGPPARGARAGLDADARFVGGPGARAVELGESG